MACITISDSRDQKTYVLLNKNDIVYISTDKMDEVMVIKTKRGKLYVKSDKKTPADRLLEADCLKTSTRARNREKEMR